MKVKSLISSCERRIREEFDVYAIAVWKSGEVRCCVWLEVFNETGQITWKGMDWIQTSDITVTDPTIPADWECHIFDHQFVRLLLGPPFISASVEEYIKLVERESEQIQKFREYLDRLEDSDPEQRPNGRD